jgi:hypothetical protein
MELEHSENYLLERKNDNGLYYSFCGTHTLHKISDIKRADLSVMSVEKILIGF